MTKVLVIRNAYDKDMGGAEQYALNLCIVLQQEGYTPILMTRVPSLLSKASAEKIETLRGRWHSTQEWGKHYFLRFPLMTLWYMYIVLRHHIDVVHPQGRDDFIFASVAAGLLRKRVIWTDHADLKYILDLKNHPFPFLKKWTIFASKFTSNIICVSAAEKQKIIKNAPQEFVKKLLVVHNGVFTPESVEPAVRTASEKTSPLLVSNARLVPDKGISELLQMVARLAYANVHLWIVGGYSGNLKKFQTEAESLGIDRRVKFIGYVDDPNNYVAAGDIFVHASYHEAFSLAIVEAAVLGKPIVATNVGGAPEIIDSSSGILVPAKDVNALVIAIDYLLNNPEIAKKLGHHISIKAKKNFMFDTIVREKILPLYS